MVDVKIVIGDKNHEYLVNNIRGIGSGDFELDICLVKVRSKVIIK